MKLIRNIVVATDFSAASRPAFQRAMEMAAANDAALWIAHVAPLPPDGYGLPRMYDEMDVAIRSDAEKKLKSLVSRARKAGVRARALLLKGVPHDAIMRTARTHRADLVVLGTHGRTGMARFFVGSVAARVVATASCPVLTVRSR